MTHAPATLRAGDATRPATRATASIATLLTIAALVAAWRAPVQAAPSAVDLQLRINPNAASAAELQLLPGIGPKLSAAIVAYRRQVADPPAFRTPDDLARVKRIGPVTVARLRPLLDCGGASPSSKPED